MFTEIRGLLKNAEETRTPPILVDQERIRIRERDADPTQERKNIVANEDRD